MLFGRRDDDEGGAGGAWGAPHLGDTSTLDPGETAQFERISAVPEGRYDDLAGESLTATVSSWR